MQFTCFLRTCSFEENIMDNRAETNTRFARIFTWLHNYSNARKVFGYTTNNFEAVILAYLVIIYIFIVILVIQ